MKAECTQMLVYRADRDSRMCWLLVKSLMQLEILSVEGMLDLNATDRSTTMEILSEFSKDLFLYKLAAALILQIKNPLNKSCFCGIILPPKTLRNQAGLSSKLVYVFSIRKGGCLPSILGQASAFGQASHNNG